MTDPYRHALRSCPACNRALREFHKRLVCDDCDGMFLLLEDLTEQIRQLTGVVPALTYVGEAAGTRPCPHCALAMSTCTLELAIDHETVRPKPTLDRCGHHGIWFDGEELAAVFQKVIGKGPGGGVDRKPPTRLQGNTIGGEWRSHSGVPEFWGSLGSTRPK